MALRVCHISSELAPFAKSGGLADVSAALTRALHAAGHDARVFVPMYGRVRNGPWTFTPVPRLQDIPVKVGERTHHVSVSTAPLPGFQAEAGSRAEGGSESDGGAEAYFVRCPELFGGDELYRGDDSDAERFALLARAALECCQYLQWAPDVVHCHDWHAGLAPLYLRTAFAWDELFAKTRTVISIHNIGYQGTFPAELIDRLGFGEVRELFHQEHLAEGRFSFLETGLMYAGVVTTVSETYAREIQTAELGMGLDDLLRRRSDHLVGIVNGVDYEVWDPRNDAHIAKRFSAEKPGGKADCKRALMAELELPYDERAPALACVSRLTGQKGFELLPDVLPVLLQREDLRFVVLGSGEERYEEYFDWLRRTWPGKVAFRRGYDDPLAHRIEAGADMFLMPSRYEPCGLNQMYSLRYGTVPVVRRTGGLADTVEPYVAGAEASGSSDRGGASDRGTGFLFHDFDPHALLGALDAALQVWRDEPRWRRLMRRGMDRDFSWDRQVEQYIDLYERLVRGQY